MPSEYSRGGSALKRARQSRGGAELTTATWVLIVLPMSSLL